MPTIPDPATTEWVPLWNLNDAGSAAPTAHHATHEIGGTDVIQNVAWLNQANTFTADQTISKLIPRIGFNDTTQGTDLKLFRIYNANRVLSFSALNDAVTTVIASPLTLDRAGNATVGSQLFVTVATTSPIFIATSTAAEFRTVDTGQVANSQMFRVLGYQGTLQIWAATDVGAQQTVPLQLQRDGAIRVCSVGTNPSIYINDPTQAANSRVWRIMNQYALLKFYKQDDGESGFMSVLALDRIGNAMVYARLQIGNSSGVTATAPALRLGTTSPDSFQMVDIVTGDASNWAGVRAHCFISTGVYNNLADLTCGSTNFTAGVNCSAGNIVAQVGYIMSGGVMYPGQITNGATQSSWYLASHSSYGLYSNTGMFFGGSVTCGGNFATNQINCSNLIGSGYLSLTGNAPYSTRLYVTGGPGTYAYTTTIQDNETANSYLVMYLNWSNGGIGSIASTPSTVVYNTTSDRRLKNDRGRATDVTALRQVIIHDFNWKVDGAPDRGLFAQEAHALFPQAITPGTDELTVHGTLKLPWMIDHSKLVPHLIVGWQQHDEEIASLKAELAALKQRIH